MKTQASIRLFLLYLPTFISLSIYGQGFPPINGKYNPGHYLAIQKNNELSDIDYLNDPSVVGISKRYLWKELELSEGVYDLSSVSADLAICQAAGKQLVAFITDKSFNKGDILPDYLDQFTIYSGSTVIVNRWNPYVVDRFIALGGAFAAKFDTVASFEGIALQETALSVKVDTLTAYGYSAELYKKAYVDILTGIGDTLKNSRIFWYMNFFPQGNAKIGEIIDSVIPYQVVVHSPDILPYRISLQKITYPFYDTYQGKLPLACAMQWDSYRHHKNDTSGVTRDEVDLHEEGYIPMDEMFFFGRDELHLNYVFWQYIEWPPKPGAFNIRDAIPVIRQYPLFNYISSVPGCFFEGGIGSFDETSDYDAWYKNGLEYGEFFHESSQVYSGSHSVRVEVTSNNTWQVRMLNTACTFEILKEKKYQVSFFLKGDAGNSFGISLLDGEQDPKTDLTVSSAEWEEYTTTLTPSTDQPDGKIRINFESPGTYYIDEILVTETDCYGTPGGSASYDSCGVCTNGETGIMPGKLCTRVTITPDNENIRYNGAVTSSISDTSAILLRFNDDYLDALSISSQKKARTQSGISISFKTSSPLIVITFDTLENAEHRTRNFAVFRDGELYSEGVSSLEFEIMNPESATYEYEIFLPTFSGVVFKGLEIIDGYELKPLDPDTNPAYIAIGNSITHGKGQSFGSHLTYPFHIADSLNYRLYNLAIGGSRINSNVVSNIESIIGDPELITVLWGYNDAKSGSADLSVSMTDYRSMMIQLAEKYSNTTICGILQTYTLTTTMINPDNSIQRLRDDQLNILKDLHLKYSNIKIIDGWEITDENDLADTVHLSNKGAMNLARGIIGELNKEMSFAPAMIHAQGIGLYPNPTTGIVFIERPFQAVITISCFDLSGSKVFSGEFSEASIDLSFLMDGVYLCELSCDGKPILSELLYKN